MDKSKSFEWVDWLETDPFLELKSSPSLIVRVENERGRWPDGIQECSEAGSDKSNVDKEIAHAALAEIHTSYELGDHHDPGDANLHDPFFSGTDFKVMSNLCSEPDPLSPEELPAMADMKPNALNSALDRSGARAQEQNGQHFALHGTQVFQEAPSEAHPQVFGDRAQYDYEPLYAFKSVDVANMVTVNAGPALIAKLEWRPDVLDAGTAGFVLFRSRIQPNQIHVEDLGSITAKFPESISRAWAQRLYLAFIRTDLTGDNLEAHRLKNFVKHIAASATEVRAWCWQILVWVWRFHIDGWCLPLSMAEGKNSPQVDLSVVQRLEATEAVLEASKLVCKDILDNGLSAIQRLVARPNQVLEYKKTCKKANDWRGKKAGTRKSTAQESQPSQTLPSGGPTGFDGGPGGTDVS